MIEFIHKLFNRDYRSFGAARSYQWPAVRMHHLSLEPFCTVCGCRDKKVLIVHHIKPFHLFPELELSDKNLITLCESAGMNCHITFGHLGNFHSYNSNVEEDIATWHIKVANRPIG